MKVKPLLLVAFLFSIVISQPIKDDAWIESGQMLRYPNSKYFTAVGIGSSEKFARENATVEIRRQISSTINSEQVFSEFSLTTNNTQKDSSVLSMKNKISVIGDIAGVEIIATSTRQSDFYAFAVLDKEKFISLQRTKITELQSELLTTNTLANKAIGEQKIASAISLLNSVKEKILAIQSERLLLSAATKLTDNESIPVSRVETDTKISELLNSIRITVGGGNNQTVFAGQIPTEPFSAIVTANAQPIENLSVSLFDAKNKKIATAYSDNSGVVYFFLDQNASSARGTYKYTAKIDLTGVKGAEKLPTAGFSYTVKTQDLSAQIAISVSSDLRNGVSAIEKAAGEMLSNHGVLNNDCSCLKIMLSISDEPRETIAGVSAARTFVRSNANIQITVSDTKGKQLYSSSVSNLGAGNDRISAVSNGISKIQLGSVLSDIQTKILNYEQQEQAKNTNKPQEPKKKIAVFPLKHMNFSGYWYSNSNYESLSTMVTTALVNTNAFTVLERQQLVTAQSDKKFGGEEEIESAKTLGADWAVVGNVARAGGNLIEVDIRIVNVYSSEIIASVSSSGKSIYDFRNIAQNLIDKLNISAPVGVNTECCK